MSAEKRIFPGENPRREVDGIGLMRLAQPEIQEMVQPLCSRKLGHISRLIVESALELESRRSNPSSHNYVEKAGKIFQIITGENSSNYDLAGASVCGDRGSTTPLFMVSMAIADMGWNESKKINRTLRGEKAELRRAIVSELLK
ncbi:MAG: hypothetical protein KKD39_02680 [Candidatus Altiarchaeota archaeon]|nr:hypothetical protein [Candidatus Altiarchaeota archaeon]